MTTRLIIFFVYLITKLNYDLWLFRGSLLTQKSSFRRLHRDIFSRLSQLNIYIHHRPTRNVNLIRLTDVRETFFPALRIR